MIASATNKHNIIMQIINFEILILKPKILLILMIKAIHFFALVNLGLFKNDQTELIKA